MLSRADLVAECHRLIGEALLVAHLPAAALPIHPDYGDTAVVYARRCLAACDIDGPVHARVLRRAIRATAAAVRSVRVLDLWATTMPAPDADRWWPVGVAGALRRRDRVERWTQGNHTGPELRAMGYLCTRGLIEVGYNSYAIDPAYVPECVGYGEDVYATAVDGAPEVFALWAEAHQSNRLILNLNLLSADNFGRRPHDRQGLTEDICSVVGGAA